VTLWTLATDIRYMYLNAYLWFGFIYGMTLQYGRFCMASAIRDLFAVRVPRMTVGIMIGVVLFSHGSAYATAVGKSTFHASPLGIHSVIGGLIFGIGMVFTAAARLDHSAKSERAAYPQCWCTAELRAGTVRGCRGWLNSLTPSS
jgi:hypothetical protein